MTALAPDSADLIGTPAFVHGRQRSQLRVLDLRSGEQRLVVDTADHLEAPNWSPDGQWLLCNGGGRLLRIAADGRGAPQAVDTEPALDVNNDHVVAPDGRSIYVSENAGGHLYALPWGGGAARRVSNVHPAAGQRRHYLHGISPDGATLVYVGISGSPGVYGLYAIPAAGGPDTTLLEPGVPVDGPEFSPDGAWVYFNAEDPARAPGHAQLYRMRPDGSGVVQLTHDERVNWFPHPSPDGQWLVCLSYPPGTRGHPANRPVQLRLMGPDGQGARDVATLLGGQGSLNVNSWSPDSSAFAFVSYPAAPG